MRVSREGGKAQGLEALLLGGERGEGPRGLGSTDLN